MQQGEIAYNPSIEYFSTGVQVDDWGGRLGIGWNDNFSATITRTVGSVPDEYANRRLTVAAYQHFSTPATQAAYDDIVEAEWAVANGTTGAFDPEYDVFSFNLFGNSGQFVIVGNNAELLTHQEKIRIQILGTTPTFSFCLTDNNGFKYYFENEIEYTSIGNDGVVAPPVATAWFLNKIVSPRHDELIFTYTTMSYASKAGFYQNFRYKGRRENDDTFLDEEYNQHLYRARENSYGVSRSFSESKYLFEV